MFLHLLHIRNPWYEWLVRPYSAGTCTLQEAPSCAWRTNATLQAPLEAVACKRLFGKAPRHVRLLPVCPAHLLDHLIC